MLMTNLALLGGLSAMGYWYLYPLLWVAAAAELIIR